MQDQSMELTALLARIAKGDEDAFALFYDFTSARAFAVIRRVLHDSTGSEDVMSDVYMQIWQQARRYDSARGKPLSWLLMICHSRALDFLRRQEDAFLHAEPETLRPDLFCDEQTPADILQNLDNQTAVHAALQQLNNNERELVLLAFFRGLSHQEIADYTGKPLGSIKTIMRRALKTLRAALESHTSSGEIP